jgi:hypothetical protein
MADAHAALSPAAVVRKIKASIRAANIGDGREDLVVTKVELSLATILDQSGGGEFEWKVPFVGLTLKGGVKLTRSNTSKLSITLVPPSPEEDLRELGIDTAALEENIVHAVADLRNAIAEAAVDEPRFLLEKGGIELEFVVTREGSLSLLASGEHKDEVTHTMTLTLGRKSELGKERKNA